jgi:hypothetical protein
MKSFSKKDNYMQRVQQHSQDNNIARLCAVAFGQGSSKQCQKDITLIKKENQILFIYKEIQSGAVAKSYMTNGPLIYREVFSHFLIY